MSKKKAIKVIAASAIAASSFAAVAPHNADAASSLSNQVSSAKKEMKKAQDKYFSAKSYVSTKTMDSYIKKAKDAYNKAKKAVEKSKDKNKKKYLADLKASYKYIKNAEGYRAGAHNAYNAAKALNKEVTAIEALIAAKDFAGAEKAITALNANIAKAEKAVKDTIYGGNAEKIVMAKYTATVKTQSKDLAEEVAEALKAPAVESVSAINAKEIVFTFNKAIKKSDVVHTDGTLVNGVISLTSLDNSAVTADDALATLSEDGKTLTLQAKNAEVFNGRYDVVIAKGAFKTTDGKDIEKYETTTVKFEDKVAPSITGTSKVTSTQVKINFSEPVNEVNAASLLAKASFKYADGTAIDSNDITGSVLSADKKSLTVGLADADIVVGKDIVVTFIGVKDYAGNIINPNPASVTIQKGNKDGVAPTVVDVKAINNKTVEVKFSEELASAPTVSGMSGILTYTQDSKDKTVWTVKSDTAQTGLKAVTVSAGYTDLSGETGAEFAKVVNFDIDTVAPKLVSATVVKGTDNAEYLELTFDEEVAKLSTLATIDVAGTKVKDYVTTSVSGSVLTAKLVVDTDNEKVARVKLTDLVSGADVEGAVYDLTLTGKTAASATVAIFEDISGNAGATSIKATFTRGKDGVAASNQKATIDTGVGANGILVGSDNKTVTVGFNQELDGASATDINNYKFDGAVVEKAVLNAYNAGTGKQTVTLTLKAGSNVFTGERNVTINGVKAKNGLAMDTYYTTEVMNENVAPTVTKAVLSGTNEVTLTFSEAVINAASSGADFELYIGGVKVTANDTITTATQTTAAKTLVLTLEANVTADDLVKGLTIKALDTIDVQDSVGNIASVPNAIVVGQ